MQNRGSPRRLADWAEEMGRRRWIAIGHTMAMGAIVLPDFPGRLTAAVELLETIVVDPYDVMAASPNAPMPSNRRGQMRLQIP